MYFWNVQRLEADLAAPGLSARQELSYLLPVVAAITLTFVSVPEHNLWSAVFGASVIVVAGFGTIYAYHCNGGAQGQQFASRFFALMWVCGIRWLLMLVVPLSITAVVIPGTPWTLVLPGDIPPLSPLDVFMRIVLLPPLFWMVGSHLRQVAARDGEEPIVLLPEDERVGLEPLED
jgi:hypothetical protein